jgi:16S rRNA processing protein RimM
MLQKEDCFYLGRVTKKHGYKGEFQAKFDADDVRRYENIEALLFDLKGELVPFPITKCAYQKNDVFLLKIDGIDSEDDLYRIIGSDIYLPLDLLPDLGPDDFYYHEIEGFKVMDKTLGEIGIVKFIREDTAQDIIYIQNKDDKEILIPMVDGIYQGINKEEKLIFIDAPNGLVEVYLE